MRYAAIFKILEMAAILNLALVHEHEIRRTLLRGQVLILFLGDYIQKGIPDAVWVVINFLYGKRARLHGGEPHSEL